MISVRFRQHQCFNDSTSVSNGIPQFEL
uniref:Uncharacterized protein n=1 Tax=Anguilla anguilla TaxID=7936 RepID=A0A0E9TKL1_ANGAN